MTTPLGVFVAIWQEKIPAAVLPYVEAVNNPFDADTQPDEWGAAIVQSATRSDVTLGSMPWVEEAGTILIGLFTRSGSGPAALDQAVDYIRATFHGVRRDGLLITQVDGPHDVDPAGAGEWWQMAMTAHYTFQTRRDASGPDYGNWSGFPDTPPAPLPPGP
jgi:hypothetical protein